ncbi:unnamed protein product [Mytilus coruscus]|uniref:Endonuclease/exonuclease/phosphatase domain-containing protein n=1 Tax=Mytilus coruscus TaxID=42192 RepID=A0A6J8EL12_MYTCO|nr:unnamed protein product [Mytilus coruscus]
MPTNNSENSYLEYTECLNIISSILSTYSATHRIIIAGDFNGTLKPPRNYNKHDRLLQAFVQEMNLKQTCTDKSTFFHHSGLSCSQTDYILDNTTSTIISNYKTHDRCQSNTSSHVPVSAKIEVKANVKQKIVKPNFASQFKLQWNDLDSESFNALINEELTQYKIESHSLEENIQSLCNCLKKAAAVAVPSKFIKLKGPIFKAPPTTLSLLQICKEKCHFWKSHGKLDDHSKTDKILAQRNLRKQMRREQYIDRAQFYKEVMDNPSNEMFHRLIRRNRGNRNKDSKCIMENGELHYSATDQTQSFSKYFEDLALPKDKGYDPEFLDLCNVRHKIIQQLCEQENITTEFSTQNICDAIKQLHSGKATDELGLAADHFKNSPAIVTQFLTDCFNNIMKDKLIPHIFKSGIVIPVLKKGKIQ